MKEIFSKNKVNIGRQTELDIAKALSIIFMIFLHALMVVSVFNNEISIPYQLIIGNILGKPYAAPIFMFCMGVGVVYSRHSQADVMIKRGVKLFLLGILVNVFEFFIPCYLSGILLHRWDIFPTAGGLLLFCVDILAFAGLSFILMGILKKFNLSNKAWLIIAAILSILGTLLRFTDFHNDIINLFAGNFIGSAGGFTAFPLFNWFIFPAMGYIWGQYFIRCKDKNKFFKYWPILLLISIVYFVASTQIPDAFLIDNHHYYFMTTPDAIMCLINIHGCIGLCYTIKDKLPEKITKIFTILSTHITIIYVIQWLIIPIIMILIEYYIKGIVFTDLTLFTYSIIIIIISTIISIYIKKIITPKHKTK